MLIINYHYILQPVGMYPGKYRLSDSEGDCSLTIYNVDISIDDGEWQCQVQSRMEKNQE